MGAVLISDLNHNYSSPFSFVLSYELYDHELCLPSSLLQTLTLLFSDCSQLESLPDYPKCLRDFTYSLPMNIREGIPISYDRLLPHSFQSIILYQFCLLTPFNLVY
jgi:hypothetical protein